MRLIAAVMSGLLLFALAPGPVVRAQSADLPAGWLRAGDHPGDYEMAVDPKGGKTGKSCALIRGKGAAPQGFGTLMQTFDASEYAGKRLRLSASIRWEGITSWAGLWMRVDGATPAGSQMPALLAFDNMQNRPMRGSSGWTPQAVVLDVPAEARAISFGILLSGPGQAWLDDLKLEPVGADVKVTGSVPGSLAKKPNLTFEK
jgi:hypothetical protein